MPTINSQMPVVFDNGCSWVEFEGHCSECGNVIHEDMLRGLVSLQISHTIVIDAVGICKHCRVLTTFYNRLHDDMRVTGIRGGKWHSWKAERSFIEKLTRVFVKLFKGCASEH